MSAPLVPPDETTLRAFLLGTLTENRIATVREWLDASPDAAAQLNRLRVGDELIAALRCMAGPSGPLSPAVERIVRSTSLLLRGTTGSAETATPTGDGTTDLTDEREPPDFRRSGQSTTGETASFAPPVPDVVTSWPPVRLGGYRIIRELGHGGMGYVFEAEDEKLGRRVAVKVLVPELARRPDAAARFLREARAAAAIEHDNVVPVLHVGEEGGTPFIVMPLLKGESLEKRLKRDRVLPPESIASIGRDVAAGLAAAHAQGQVHRDVKPANVWLDEGTGRARVLDFGLARLGDGADALTAAGALLGTPAYVAPEQIDGFPADLRSDLFGLGATLYECATGLRAFQGPTITAILKAVTDHHPRPPAELNPDVPAGLSALIMRMLAKNPDDRPATATDVLSALALPPPDGTATAAWQDVSTSPNPRRIPRPWLVGGAFAAVATVIVVTSSPLRSPSPVLVETPQPQPETSTALHKVDPPAPTRLRGKVEVRVAREDGSGKERLLRLNEPGALPLRQTDRFRIEGEVDVPAYLYVVWVDPEHDVTPVYPWDPKVGWGSRPTVEVVTPNVSLPPDVSKRYTAPGAKPGVATMVLFARSTPLDVPDEVVRKWFEALPELPLPPGGDAAAIWFDDYVEVRDPLRLRTFGEVGSDDAFVRWQGLLQKSLGINASFQTAVSFARTGRK